MQRHDLGRKIGYPARVKLRIRADTLRLRLTRGEVERLRETGEVSETTHFGPGRALTYALVVADIDDPIATFADDRVAVRLPTALAHAWTDSEQVGIAHDQPLDEGRALALLIEKDFQCLAPREGEDDSDAFPHPEAASGASC